MRTKVGVVTSTKMDKTIVVTQDTSKSHPKYKKRFKITRKFYAHDELNSCVVGNIVEIAEGRPLSKTKCWTLVKVIQDRA
jgi:small subunit ribosomal protein S17